MVSLSPDSAYSSILSHPAIAEIWSDHARVSYYLQFESALAQAQSQLDIIPSQASELIVSACSSPTWIDYAQLKTETEQIGYPVLPVVRQLVRHVNSLSNGQRLGEYAHWGATTQDVTDTASVLQMRDTLLIIDQLLDDIAAALTTLISQHKHTPMAARSNLQHAVPITLGFKLARLLATFLRHRERLAQLRTRLLTLEFSGAAGTLATLSPTGSSSAGPECQTRLASLLALHPPTLPRHTNRDGPAEYGFVLSLLCATSAKFALDLKLSMQSEVAELKEPYAPHRGSSSTMPQKRNPIGCVYVTALAATVRQLAAALTESMQCDHERGTGPWEIEWIVLPQISAQAGACLRQTRDLLTGLEVYPEAMQKNLDLSRGLICAEAVMMGLGPKMGRQRAHDIVYEVCRGASEREVTLVEALLENKEVTAAANEDELRAWCDPKGYLGYSVEMAEKAIQMAAASQPKT